MEKRMTKRVRISFLAKAGDRPPLRVKPGMTKRVGISFIANVPAKRMQRMKSREKIVDEEDNTRSDPDRGLELRPEVIERLRATQKVSKGSLVPFDEMKRRTGQGKNKHAKHRGGAL